MRAHQLQAARNYRALTSEILTILRDTKVTGLSIALIENYRLVWAKGFGLQQASKADSVTPQTLFQAASITKSVVALTAMVQVQQGRLSLDSDVNQYLTNWQIPYQSAKQPITLRQLLSHTAGLSALDYRPYCPEESLPALVSFLEGSIKESPQPVTQAYPPGKHYAYSRAGYAVVQQLLMDRSRQDFAQLIEQSVLQPLAMTRTTFDPVLPNAKHPQVALGHDKGKSLGCPYYKAQPLAAGGLWSTPTDLAHLLIELQLSLKGSSNRILDVAHTKLLLRPVEQKAPPQQYSLGFSLEKRGPGVAFFGHDGHNPGYVCSMLASVDQGFGLVVMSNSEQGWKAINRIKKVVGRLNWGF